MRLHFPDLNIFVAAMQADPALITTVQQVVIEEVEYEVSAILASSEYASTLAAFFATPSHEQQSAHQHAQRIIAEARVTALIASNTAITQAAEVPLRPGARRQGQTEPDEDVLAYSRHREQEKQKHQQRKDRAMQLLSEGSSITEVAKILELSDTTISRWRSDYAARGGYIHHLYNRRLSKPEEKQLLKGCLAHTPRAYGLNHEEWTVEAIIELAHQQVNKTLTREAAEAFLQTLNNHQTSIQHHHPSHSISLPTIPTRTTQRRTDTTPYSRARSFTSYSIETKARALDLMEKGNSTTKVSAQLKITTQTLCKWRRQQSQRSEEQPLTQQEMKVLLEIIQTQKPSDHGLSATEWHPTVLITLIAVRFRKALTSAQITKLLDRYNLPLTTPPQNTDDSPSSPVPTPSTATEGDIDLAEENNALTPEITIEIDLTEEESPSSSPEAPVTTSEQLAVTPPPAPSSPSSWMPEDALLDWIADISDSAGTQSLSSESAPITLAKPTPSPQPAPEEGPQTWLSDSQLAEWITADGQHSASQFQDTGETTEIGMGDHCLLDWLLNDSDQLMPQPQQQPQPQPQVPPSLPSIPLPSSQAGLVRVQIEELRLIIISSMPRNHGIHSDDWAPDAVKLFILQRYQRLLSLAQVQELLDSHILPFQNTE